MSIPPAGLAGTITVGGLTLAVAHWTLSRTPEPMPPDRFRLSVVAFFTGIFAQLPEPSRFVRRGTPAKLRRGRGGHMRPSLRVSRIVGVRVGRPRHASSTVSRRSEGCVLYAPSPVTVLAATLPSTT